MTKEITAVRSAMQNPTAMSLVVAPLRKYFKTSRSLAVRSKRSGFTGAVGAILGKGTARGGNVPRRSSFAFAVVDDEPLMSDFPVRNV